MVLADIRRQVRLAAREAYSISLQGLSYADRKLRYDANLEWLLILTMPNSGSTALAKLLLTAKTAQGLNERCEGEWLVPSLSNLRTRWDDNLKISPDRIRARWMAQLNRSATGLPRLVVEKSPPNMVRIDQLRAMLAPMKTYTLILVRNPLAVCEGWHRRYGKDQLAKTSMPELANVDDELEYFRLLGQCWVERGRYLVKQMETALCVVRYEDLVADPTAITSLIAATIPSLRDVRPDASVEVKDYAKQQLKDMNEQQISALSDSQVAAISSGLEPGIDVVTSLGYALR